MLVAVVATAGVGVAVGLREGGVVAVHLDSQSLF